MSETDLLSIQSIRSENLLRIVQQLIKEQRATAIIPPSPVVPLAYIEEKKTDILESIDVTNYAPPGYLVWNFYYDHPYQKIPNDTSVHTKNELVRNGVVVGYIYKPEGSQYKVVSETSPDLIHEISEQYIQLDDIEPQDWREYFHRLHMRNVAFHNANLPTKDLDPLDILLYGKKITNGTYIYLLQIFDSNNNKIYNKYHRITKME